MHTDTAESLAMLLLAYNTALVVWMLFRKQLQESVGELALTVFLLGITAATVVPLAIGAQLRAEAEPTAMETSMTDQAPVATK
jgi:hypothetical protein